jgi:hypothetical protein
MLTAVRLVTEKEHNLVLCKIAKSRSRLVTSSTPATREITQRPKEAKGFPIVRCITQSVTHANATVPNACHTPVLLTAAKPTTIAIAFSKQLRYTQMFFTKISSFENVPY